MSAEIVYGVDFKRTVHSNGTVSEETLITHEQLGELLQKAFSAPDTPPEFVAPENDPA